MKNLIQYSIIISSIFIMACGDKDDSKATNTVGSAKSSTSKPAKADDGVAPQGSEKSKDSQTSATAPNRIDVNLLKEIKGTYVSSKASCFDTVEQAKSKVRDSIEFEIQDSQFIVRSMLTGCKVEETHKLAALDRTKLGFAYVATTFKDIAPENTCDLVKQKGPIPRGFPLAESNLQYEREEPVLRLTENQSCIVVVRKEKSEDAPTEIEE